MVSLQRGLVGQDSVCHCKGDWLGRIGSVIAKGTGWVGYIIAKGTGWSGYGIIAKGTGWAG